MRGIRRICILSGLAVVPGGCYTGLQDHAAGERAPDGADDGSNGADGGDADSGDPSAPSCGADGQSLAPLRRLTRQEYDNTVRDLLGDDTAPARDFTPDEQVAGFEANAVAPLSKNQLDEYMSVAEQWDLVVGCDAVQTACVDGFIDEFGRRAFRRPLSDSQRADYRALFQSASAQWGPTQGVQAVVTAMLLSPAFLYHVEPTTGAPGELVALDDHTIASRLSYFIWQSMPDDELLDVAEAGALGDPDTIAEQARRMLEDPRAESAIASFHAQWLGTDRLQSATKDPSVFPEWTPAVVEAVTAESGRFAAEVVQNGDASLRTLLTASWTVADPELAALYGVPALAAGDTTLQLDPDQRAGVLTQLGFLAANAHAADVSWVYRGKFVREKLLCNELPPPPPGVEVNEANDPNRVDDPACMGCHLMMDPIGQGFDHYSAIGVFRTEDDFGDPVDASGEVVGQEEIGTFDSAIDLAHALADSATVHDCVTRQWFRYATRRAEQDADDCTVSALSTAFVESDGDVRELIVGVVQSDAFRFRSQPEL
jgi:hypothetical protein